MNDKDNPNYYAIIPASVRYDKELTANAKLLYGEITALCNKDGKCWANNDYFSKLYSVSKVSISKWISQLCEKKYIFSEIIYKENSKEIQNRYLTLNDTPIKEKFNTYQRKVKDPIKEKFNTPIKEKFKDNNTSINNTSINNKVYIPKLEEVVKFFVENGFDEALGKKAFQYYEDGNWTDSNGKKVKNWKQKMRAVWFKEENKSKKGNSIRMF